MKYRSIDQTPVRLILSGLVSIFAFAVLGGVDGSQAAQESTSAGPADPLLIEDLVAANHILYQEGIVDAFGHVSVRHNLDPNRFLLSRSTAPELVTAADILEYDLDANPINLDDRRQYLETLHSLRNLHSAA